jgi:glycosyltransferase involved in cell wall biosynthesis
MNDRSHQEPGERILVYDFNASGHCPGWMHLAAMGFLGAGAEVWVACRAGTPEVRPWADKLIAAGCRVITIPDAGGNHAANAAAIARREGIRKVFFPNFDSVVYEMGKHGVRGALDGLDIGGIWLRPELAAIKRGPLCRLLEKLVRTRANKLRRKHARAVDHNRRGLEDFLPNQRRVARVRLFFTSTSAASAVGELLLPGETRMLCDPWLARGEIPRAEARVRLGLDDSRVILLHLGTSRPEKGLKDVCDAMLQLDHGTLDRLLLLRAGRVDRGDAPSLRRLEQKHAARVLDRYLSEDELAGCYAAADWVLLPYRHQAETSGVLIHAAAHGRPVIASDYGWIGSATRQHGLGSLFPHTDTAALAALLAKVANGDAKSWDAAGMEQFAAENSPGKFQETLVEQWLRESPNPPAGGR